MNKGWKYGLIKVAFDIGDMPVQINMLVELYLLGETGEYDTFCRTSLQTLEEIEMAKRDIERDGINEYFFNNGTFKWVPEKEAYNWDWIPNIKLEVREKGYEEAEEDDEG